MDRIEASPAPARRETWSSRIPDRVFTRAFAARTALVWGVMRAVAAVGQQVMPITEPHPAGALYLSAPALVFLYVMVIAAVLLDARSRREDQFLANLGLSRSSIAGVALVTVTLLEAGLRMVTGLIP